DSSLRSKSMVDVEEEGVEFTEEISEVEEEVESGKLLRESAEVDEDISSIRSPSAFVSILLPSFLLLCIMSSFSSMNVKSESIRAKNGISGGSHVATFFLYV